jgi:hypothetical protein
MEVAIQRVLEAMAHMELRLTATLAGSGGEQVLDSFSYATAPRYDDEVFGSSAFPAYDDVPVDDELYRDEIAKVLALLEYNGMTSSATVLADDYTSTSNSPIECSTMGFPNVEARATDLHGSNLACPEQLVVGTEAFACTTNDAVQIVDISLELTVPLRSAAPSPSYDNELFDAFRISVPDREPPNGKPNMPICHLSKAPHDSVLTLVLAPAAVDGVCVGNGGKSRARQEQGSSRTARRNARSIMSSSSKRWKFRIHE